MVPELLAPGLSHDGCCGLLLVTANEFLKTNVGTSLVATDHDMDIDDSLGKFHSSSSRKMTILCLHGAYGSASHFKTQLRPFIDAVENSGAAKFKWINGGHIATPPAGFDAYFGPGPLYRFIDFDGVSELDDILAKLREFPEEMTAEDTMRSLVGSQQTFSAPAVQNTLRRLIKALDEDPDITGILGYSEGATVAGSLILEEKRLWEEEGRPRQIKNAVFFAGWPPVRLADGSVHCLLADECDAVIDVPTCHVVGCNDPYIHGAMALFGMCDEDSAMLFDHGKGHTVPRDARTLRELVSVVRGVWTQENGAIQQPVAV